MDRKIKFRVWDKKNKKMISPDGREGFNFAIAINGETCSGYIDGDMVSHYDDNYVYQQFTGLKDKNGKDIYEGDLLNYQKSVYTILEVYWNVDAAKFNTKVHQQHNKMIYVVPSPMDKLNNYETIGNIFENPKLLNAV